jgi:oligopeptide transport system substrate-binding protein
MTKIISNGPFVFSERIPGKCILLKKNDNYWDADNVLLESVMFFTETNQPSAVKKFIERKVDVVEVLFNDEQSIGNGSDMNELRIAPAFSGYGLAFNMVNPALKDKRVRRALALVIDREKLLVEAKKSYSLAAYGFVPPVGTKYKPDPFFPYDVEEAKRLLLEAGFNQQNKFPKIKMLCNIPEFEFNISILKKVAENWKKELDIDCVVESKEFDSFLINRKRLNFDLVKISYGGIYYDPAVIVDLFESHSLKNYGKWHNNKYDEIIAQVWKADNKKERRLLVKKAESCLANEMPVIPLFYDADSYLVRKTVKGWFPNAMNMHPLKFVYFTK